MGMLTALAEAAVVAEGIKLATTAMDSQSQHQDGSNGQQKDHSSTVSDIALTMVALGVVGGIAAESAAVQNTPSAGVAKDGPAIGA